MDSPLVEPFDPFLHQLSEWVIIPEEESAEFEKARHELQAEMQLVRQIATGPAVTEEEVARKEAAKRQYEALAKNLPLVATGLRDAVMGFTSGNPLAGSAALMDVCGSFIAAIASMASATAGPPGALVGALFSVASMILKSFVPQQVSLGDQLKEIVKNEQALTQLGQLGSAQKAIASLQRTLVGASSKWSYDEISVMFNPVDGNAIDKIRSATEWLEEPTNQDLEKWGQVLALQCQTYVMYMQALTIATANLKLSAGAAALQEATDKLRSIFLSNDPEQLAFLRRIVPAAQRRGTVWHVGVFTVGNNNRDSGSLFVTDSLKQGWKEIGSKPEGRVLAVTRRRADRLGTKNRALDSFPFMALFHLEMNSSESVQPGPGPAYRNRKNTNAWGLSGQWPLREHTGWEKFAKIEGAHDICMTPGKDAMDAYLYVARNGIIERYNYYARGTLILDPSVTFRTVSGASADSVCALTSPRGTSDTDAYLLDGETWIVYGGWGAPGRRFISADFSSKAADYFRVPWDDITGMAVDSRRLWVFNDRMIACVGHALLKQGLRRMDPATRVLPVSWARYDVPLSVSPWNTRGYYNGLRDISPCDDGSLYAVFASGEGIPRMYFATPTVDGKANRIVIQSTKRTFEGGTQITEGWTQIPEARANRVIKLPIFCWPLVEGLTSALERRAARPAAAPSADVVGV